MISNTSCLIVLDNIGLLDILKKLYSKIVITQEVAEEFGKNLPDWIEIKAYEKGVLKSLDEVLIKWFQDVRRT